MIRLSRVHSNTRLIFCLMVVMMSFNALGLTMKNGNRKISPQQVQVQIPAIDGPTTMMENLRHAIQLSSSSMKNITAAHEACECWGSLLNDGGRMLQMSNEHDDSVVVLSLALYASCLVRVGKDFEAIQVLSKAVSLDPNKQELRLAKAQAFQRLLMYSDARDEYKKVKSDDGTIGAVTCCLRLGDLEAAVNVLDNHLVFGNDNCPAIRGLQGTLEFLQSGLSDQKYIGDMIKSAARQDTLYRWIHSVLFGEDIEKAWTSDPFSLLIKINLCALDDPALILLDDKVHLHRILSKNQKKTSKFWPPGIIVSGSTVNDRQVHFIQKENTTSLYILKERSGYGSHGNRVLTASDALRHVKEMQQLPSHEEKLLQQMVDPPLLLLGRKFSLRIYVIHFSPSEVYLSSHGLVKLASMKMEDDRLTSDDPSLHMTNSGRDVAMKQHDLAFLRTFLESKEESFEDFWKRIRFAVEQVFVCHQLELVKPREEWHYRRQSLGIPKIMGFDFVVDSNMNPWLVEVNRFPGLEPRDSVDRLVKHRVVHEAWLCATKRLPTKMNSFQTWLEALQKYTSTTNSLQYLTISESNDDDAASE